MLQEFRGARGFCDSHPGLSLEKYEEEWATLGYWERIYAVLE